MSDTALAMVWVAVVLACYTSLAIAIALAAVVKALDYARKQALADAFPFRAPIVSVDMFYAAARRLSRLAMAASLVAALFGAIAAGLAFAEPADAAPDPAPSCAHLVDFPDSDPPRYGVCVPPEEAG